MIFLIFLLLIATPTISLAQKDKDVIVWQKDKSLVIDDFKMRPPVGQKKFAGAATTNIILKKTYCDSLICIDIYSCFYPKKSWIREHAKNEYTLKHEQIHFDISEIFARKLKKEILNRKFSKNESRLSKQIYNLHLKYWSKSLIYQTKYDSEVAHNKVKQAEWNQKIAEELLLLEDYQYVRLQIPINKSLRPTIIQKIIWSIRTVSPILLTDTIPNIE